MAQPSKTKIGWMAAIMGARYGDLRDLCRNFARLVTSLYLKMLSNLLGKWLWFESHFHFQFSARFAADRPRLKSFMLTDGSGLKVESHGCTVASEGKRQKVVSRASDRQRVLARSHFGVRMPSRDTPSNGRFEILHPGKDFLWHRNWCGNNNSPVKQWDDRVGDRLSQPKSDEH